MTTAVSDATVLIYLAKLGDLALLGELFEAVLVPEAVHEEVVDRGRSRSRRGGRDRPRGRPRCALSHG